MAAAATWCSGPPATCTTSRGSRITRTSARMPGKPGARARRDGGNGKDLVVSVPDGTVVFDEQGLLADLVGEGSEAVVARGGRGGRGNTRFAGPKNRVPRTAEAGEEGEERRLHVELRTVADLGLVGSPERRQVDAAVPTHGGHARRSPTIRSRRSRPTSGVAEAGDERFVVADIPGSGRGRARGQGARGPVPSSHHALPGARPRRGPLVSGRARRTSTPSVRSSAPTTRSSRSGRPSSWATKADLVEDPARAADTIRGLPVSAVTGEGLDAPRIAARAAVAPGGGAATAPCSVRGAPARPGAVHDLSRSGGLAGRRAATSSGGSTRPTSTTNGLSPTSNGG